MVKSLQQPRFVKNTLVILLISCFSATVVNAAFQTGSKLLSGKEIFEKKCVRCHGTTGTKGFLGAKNLQHSKLDDAAIINLIHNGKRFMPSFRKSLSDAEISRVAEYAKGFRVHA